VSEPRATMGNHRLFLDALEASEVPVQPAITTDGVRWASSPSTTENPGCILARTQWGLEKCERVFGSYRAYRMRRPPVLKSRCGRLVSVQFWMANGRASRRSRLPRL